MDKTHRQNQCSICFQVVDALEIDPAVVKVATEVVETVELFAASHGVFGRTFPTFFQDCFGLNGSVKMVKCVFLFWYFFKSPFEMFKLVFHLQAWGFHFLPLTSQVMGFPKSAVRPSDTPSLAAQDAVKNGSSLRVYLVPGGNG